MSQSSTVLGISLWKAEGGDLAGHRAAKITGSASSGGRCDARCYDDNRRQLRFRHRRVERAESRRPHRGREERPYVLGTIASLVAAARRHCRHGVGRRCSIGRDSSGESPGPAGVARRPLGAVRLSVRPAPTAADAAAGGDSHPGGRARDGGVEGPPRLTDPARLGVGRHYFSAARCSCGRSNTYRSMHARAPRASPEATKHEAA